VSAGICIEEYALALRDAVDAINGDQAAARRTIGRQMAVAAFLQRQAKAAPVPTLEVAA